MNALLALVPLRAWLIGAAALAVLAGASLIIHHRERQAAADAVVAIERANDAVRQKSETAATEVQACYDRGPEWRWDRFDSLCNRRPGQ